MGKSVHISGFPSEVTADCVKSFLESYTGIGTVYGLKIKQYKNGGPRVYALVQFTTNGAAQQIISLASRRLWYKNVSFLKAKPMDYDIVPKPRQVSHKMEVSLYFGCQVSNDKFILLKKAPSVTVHFGYAMRKISFVLTCDSVEYMLELTYENIWQIELHSPPGQTAKYLLIQLFGAPRIFENAAPPPDILFEDPILSYFQDVINDEWVRTTDFTFSKSIGQSSTLCLELPLGCQLPDFKEYFPYFKESKERFVLERGTGYSCNDDLVPIVGPPPGTNLPYSILFKVNMLVQNGCLAGPTLNPDFYRLVDPTRISSVYIEHALSKLCQLNECCYEPAKWLSGEYRKYASKKFPKSPTISLDEGLVYIHRVQITPCKVYFCGPEINVSNRVLRHFRQDIDNFLRVSFVDEDWGKVHSAHLSRRVSSPGGGRKTKLYGRILSVLQDGIIIGGKKFEFLAFSSSQLRENSTWMFSSRRGLTAADIREWMGDFRSIRNVPKYAARLGQSFGSSTETLSIERDEIENIDDITNGTKYTFSDGIGKISYECARKVAIKCCFFKDSIPSAFQIRYGGYKGVVAIDPTSSVKLSLRRSMCKFESENTKLDVLAYSKYQPAYLNRQIITLLSTLGVPDYVFEKKQREAVAQLDSILTDPLRAQDALDLMSPGENTNCLKEMLSCGYKPDAEPFLSMMLQTFRATKLMEIRTRTRIFIPSARSMMGCLDETRMLEYGEVFVQFSAPGRHGNLYDSSGYGGNQNTIVSGTEMIPRQQQEPMDYTPAPTVQLQHEVTIEEIVEYFTNYIVNDSLGMIANAHVAFADQEINKAMSSKCLELARLFSIAVDFPKTGVPAEIPADLYVKNYPDFMEKPDKPTYESYRVIGKLFREVKDIAPYLNTIRKFTHEVAKRSYDSDMEIDGFEDYVDDAEYHKGNYDYKLGNLMDYYGIKTEAEILSGSIMRMSKSFSQRKDAEAIGAAVKALRKEARAWFKEKTSGTNDDVYAKASAWYHVTYHPHYWGLYNEGIKRDHFLSFAWCVYHKLVEIKKDSMSLRRSLELSSMVREVAI
ncbi:hypothetical protein ACFE04_029609 [Oxalis oulophora]